MTQLLPQNARDKPTSAHPRIERSFMLTMASREDHNVYYRGTGGDDTSYSKAWLDTSVESNVDASHTSGGGRTTNHDASQILQCHHGSPSQPGVTAQNHTRQFVVHDYRDRALDAVHVGNRRFFGSANFPVKLHKVLDETHQMGWDHIISWASHGRCFKMHNTTAFVQDVMPKYFRQSKLTSFQRQLHLYGFKRLTRGPDNGSYYHECFLRGKPGLAYHMERVVVKGTKIKAASNPGQEPNFYAIPPVDPKECHGTADSTSSSSSNNMSVAVVAASIFHDAPCPVPPLSYTSIGFQPMQEPATKEHGVLGWYRHLAVPPKSNSASESCVGGLDLGDEGIDKDMVLDFCSAWAPHT